MRIALFRAHQGFPDSAIKSTSMHLLTCAINGCLERRWKGGWGEVKETEEKGGGVGIESRAWTQEDKVSSSDPNCGSDD